MACVDTRDALDGIQLRVGYKSYRRPQEISGLDSVYRPSEPDVPAGHSSLRVGLNRKCDRRVPDLDVGVMLVSLSNLRNFADERNAVHELVEDEGLDDELAAALPPSESSEALVDFSGRQESGHDSPSRLAAI